MAGNFRETAVKTVQVKKERLLTTLQENLETHRREYAEAKAGFEDARIQAVAKLADVAENYKHTTKGRKRVHEAYEEFRDLDRPSDHSGSYEQAIALMEWETRDDIELSINDFESYVRDNWGWQESFKNSVANYTSHR